MVGRNPESAAMAALDSFGVGTEDAMSSGLINLVSTLPTLLDDLHNQGTVKGRGEPLLTKGVALRFHSMGVWERILHTALNAEVAYFLLLFGFFGLIFELYHPGIGAAGLLGGGAVALAIYAMSVLPTELIGVVGIFIAFGLYTLDLQRGDFGIRTALGTIGLVASSLVLFRNAQGEIGLSIWATVAAVPVSLLFFISVMSAAIKARLSRPGPGAGELIGSTGLARTDIAPEGEVEAGGEVWRARTASAAIPQGTVVKIRSVLGLLLIVEQVESGNGGAR
jgi:membrane-bound serine protease (ClpP class)